MPRPTELNLHQQSRVLDVVFDDGQLTNGSFHVSAREGHEPHHPVHEDALEPVLTVNGELGGMATVVACDFQVPPQTKLAYVNSGYTITQYKASNGIVYVISAVLVPPQTPNPTTGSTGTITP